VDKLHRRVVSRIRETAARRKIPVTHLPDRAAVGRSHFWNVIAGRSSPTLAWLARIAAALEVDVADLVAPSPVSSPAEVEPIAPARKPRKRPK
jgi:hypothetical protein